MYVTWWNYAQKRSDFKWVNIDKIIMKLPQIWNTQKKSLHYYERDKPPPSFL